MATNTRRGVERALLSLSILVMCVACSKNDAMQTAPVGVVPFPSARSAAGHGVYPSMTGSDCCFLSARAELRLAKGAGARAAIFNVYVPSVRPYMVGGVSLSIKTPRSPLWVCHLPVGVHYFKYELSNAEWLEPTVLADIEATPIFIPKRLRINDDLRPLSVILLSVVYERRKPLALTLAGK